MDLFSLVAGSIRSLCNVQGARRRAVRRGTSLRAGQALENRVLLASLISTTKLTYQDKDDDNVEVTFSKPILTSLASANSIFTFDTGNVNNLNTTKQQLRTINVSGIPGAAGTTIITKAVRSVTTGGDGFAALGQIDATGRDLGAVTIDGDLGRILAGDATTTTQGLGAFNVHSLGRFGLFTGATNLTSTIQGAVASLTTKTDVVEANFRVQGGAGSGTLAAVTIGGSLIGGAASSSGRICSNGNMGPVKITGDVVGGGGSLSGTVQTQGHLASIMIGGSLIGGSGNNSGLLSSGAAMGAVTITGSVLGGAGAESGWILSPGTLASVTVGGSVVAGTGPGSGAITSIGNLGAVKITGDVRGGGGFSSGRVHSNGKLASLTIGGSLLGGTGGLSGTVSSQLDMGAVQITGSVIGSNAINTGTIFSSAKLASINIGGSLVGGGDFSGGVISSLDMGAVTINGDLIGGSGFDSGLINTNGKITSVMIGGSLIGGGNSRSGSIEATGELTTLTITGNIRGGSASGSASLEKSGFVIAGRIGTLTLGSLIAGTDNTTGTFVNNGAIRVTNDIAIATIKGSIIGNATNPALITARGQLTPAGTVDLAIGKLTVSGRVEHGLIHAGVTTDAIPLAKNADAQIGPVIVGGDWIASSLVAGALAGADNKFGTADDVIMSGVGVKNVATVFSKITSIVIGGQVLGTVGSGDHFGFVAQYIGSFKVKTGVTTFPLVAGNSNDDHLVGLLGDVKVNEI